MQTDTMDKSQGQTVSLKRIAAVISGLRTNPVFNYAMLAVLGIGVGLLSLLLGATLFGVPMFLTYFSSPLVLLLNLLPPLLLMYLLYFISGRAWIAFTFPSFFILIISMIQFFKVQIRGDPLVVSDATQILEAGAMVVSYPLTMNWKIYLAILAFVAGTLITVFFLKYELKKPPVRIITAVSIIAVSAVLYLFVYTDTEIYVQTSTNSRTEEEWTPNRNYIEKGFLYPLIYSIRDSLIDMRGNYPEWYDKQEARQAFQSYPNAVIPADKKVNVITVLLEAYADFSQFDSLDFTVDIYEPFHKLQAESYSGTLVNNVFAGATIDTERLFLTGNTHLTNYFTATNSYIHYLRSQGYHTEGFHVGDEWFYDRRPVNSILGFSAYYFLEDFDGSNRSDTFFFPAVLDMYRSREKSRPYFSFNLSYQNHGPYNSTRTHEPHLIERNGMSDEAFHILNNYLSGIHDTSARVAAFIDSLRAEPDPVVVLVFGDHMPWLGNMNSVYYELGINIDVGSEEGFLNYYSTPYFIWANDAAKETLGNDFTGESGGLSPGFLMGELFSLCSWDGDGYMQVMRELQTRIDVINSATGVFRENGVLTLDLSPDGEAAYRKLRMIEIYRLDNFAY